MGRGGGEVGRGCGKVDGGCGKVTRDHGEVGGSCGKVDRGCGEVGGGGGKWKGAPLTTGIYGARMVGVGRSLAALSVIDGGGRGRNRCFLA